eukprot:767067-Hanusia_phi.AAC.2
MRLCSSFSSSSHALSDAWSSSAASLRRSSSMLSCPATSLPNGREAQLTSSCLIHELGNPLLPWRLPSNTASREVRSWRGSARLGRRGEGRDTQDWPGSEALKRRMRATSCCCSPYLNASRRTAGITCSTARGEQEQGKRGKTMRGGGGVRGEDDLCIASPVRQRK